MPTIPEELDVFYVPHDRMKKLVRDTEEQLSQVNFNDQDSYQCLLQQLSRRFHEFKTHEDIENRYILHPLLPKLGKERRTTLVNDIHSDNRLGELVTLVDRAPRGAGVEERERFVSRLKDAIGCFTVDFIPHMQEEEEVFLPLLLEYYSSSELRELRQTIIELHNLSADLVTTTTPVNHTTPKHTTQHHHHNLTHLPPEILHNIFSYLGPRDLCHLSQVHSKLNSAVFDGTLWRHLHPVRWIRGSNWSFFPPPEFSEEEDSSYSDGIAANDITKELLSCGSSVNAPLPVCEEDEEAAEEVEEEGRVLQGMTDYLLPRIGEYVESLDLAYSGSLTNTMVREMLAQCPNLRYLDLSHTSVSDFAFKGLVGAGTCPSRHLSYIDLTGCSRVTDTTLLRIAQACSPPLMPPFCSGCCCGRSEPSNEEQVEEVSTLNCLILSGCHLVTDVGLRALAVGGGLPALKYLDLSGLPNISSQAIHDLVSSCPQLIPECLFYCDNIEDGPLASSANGCQSVKDGSQCCRNLYRA